MTREQLAGMIDHTLLKPEATADQIDQLCDEAVEYGFCSVCVNPVWVTRCVEFMIRPRAAALHLPRVCTVVGFPLGATGTEAKAFEAKRAVELGALEIDMVVNIGALIAADRATVTGDIDAVVGASKRANPRAIVKVILESQALTNDQIRLGCRCAVDANADFVKTSTGFHPSGGATVEHVRLLRQAAHPLRVKASGGIRNLARALTMLDAGANRLGMSAGVAVIRAFDSGCAGGNF